MSDNRTAFRYFATNVGVKALSFYFVPSVLFKLTFYDTKAHIYMFWAIFLFLTGNLLNHIFNGLKYSGNSKVGHIIYIIIEISALEGLCHWNGTFTLSLSLYLFLSWS